MQVIPPHPKTSVFIVPIDFRNQNSHIRPCEGNDYMIRVQGRIGEWLRQLARTAVAIYFALFVLVMIPCHALVCELPGLTSQYSFFDSNDTSVCIHHNPELCQICRTHGQLDAQAFQPFTSIIGENFTSREDIALQPTGYVIVYTPSHRAPPSFS